METLAALGLVCNIVQLTETATKTLALCKRVYEDGASIKQLDFKTNCDQLQSGCSTLLHNIANSQQEQDVQVREIAERYLKTFGELDKEFKKLDPAQSGAPTSSKIQRFGNAVRSPWRMKRITEIKARLDEYQRFMDTQVLVQLSLRLRDSGVRAQASQAVDDPQLKVMAIRLNEGQATLQDLAQILKEDLKGIRGEVEKVSDRVEELKKLQASKAQKQALKRLKASLSFPEMNSRREAIDDSYKRTFEWCFSEQDHVSWPSITKWLMGSDQLYWLVGKPGSGKSTLLNFMLEDPRTHAFLSHGTTKPPLIASFFLWEAGSLLQKSVSGLLRSLLLQLISASDETELGAWFVDVTTSLHADQPWSEKRLLSLLQAVQKQTSRRVCYFIDGLDECEDAETLVKVLRAMKSSPNTKLCVSSRPLNLFELEFGDAPRLRLQDLTRDDIEAYVRGRLSEDTLVHSSETWNSSIVDDFTKQISTQAEGIFLWVKLVVKFVLQGLRNGDEISLLYKRLSALPGDIFDLYENMWARTKSEHHVYEESAALYFHLTILEESSLVSFALAIDDKLQHDLLHGEQLCHDVTFENSLADYARLRLKLMARCAGLLEVIEKGSLVREVSADLSPMGKDRVPVKDIQLDNSSKVNFIHRTAREFLLQDKRGKCILAALPNGTYESWKRRCNVFLIRRILNLDIVTRDDFATFSTSYFDNYSTCANQFHEDNQRASSFSMTALFEEKLSTLVAHRLAIPRQRWLLFLQEEEFQRYVELSELVARRSTTPQQHWSLLSREQDLQEDMKRDDHLSHSLFLAEILRRSHGGVCTGFEFVIGILRNPTYNFGRESLSYLLGCLLTGPADRASDLSAYSTIAKLLLERGADPNRYSTLYKQEHGYPAAVQKAVLLTNPWLSLYTKLNSPQHQAVLQMLLTHGANPSGISLSRYALDVAGSVNISCIASLPNSQVAQTLRSCQEIERRKNVHDLAKAQFRGIINRPCSETEHRFLLLESDSKWCEVTLEDSHLLRNVLTCLTSGQHPVRLREEFERTGGFRRAMELAVNSSSARDEVDTEDRKDREARGREQQKLLLFVASEIFARSTTVHRSVREAFKALGDRDLEFDRLESSLTELDYLFLETSDLGQFRSAARSLSFLNHQYWNVSQGRWKRIPSEELHHWNLNFHVFSE